MSTPAAASLVVLRGDPTPEELAALVAVLAAVRPAPEPPGPRPAGGGWRAPGRWREPVPATAAPDPAGWRRTDAPHRGRSL
ncbi:acyl-CoA carboxylase epsilon subunit [Streptomyces sp. NPDC001595]|uniref:acyl-CoA carboxylase epsilon subunit n=1 Tax=Streptomyces sp. NPDC001532 TaxID=3154520 RepID=UPI00332AA94D